MVSGVMLLTPISVSVETPAITVRIPSASLAHHPSTIVGGNVSGQCFGHGGPVAGREARIQALVHLGCRVFQPRCRPAEFVEAGERGVEIGFVENLVAVNLIAADYEEARYTPFSIQPFS